MTDHADNHADNAVGNSSKATAKATSGRASFGGKPSQRAAAHPFAALNWDNAHTAAIQMRYSDTDAMGHVNNATYITYLETARIQLMRDIGANVSDIRTVVARIEMDYAAEIRLGSRVEVQTLSERLGNSSFTLAVRVLADGIPSAYARTVLVNLDEDGSPSPLTEKARNRLSQFAASTSDSNGSDSNGSDSKDRTGPQQP